MEQEACPRPRGAPGSSRRGSGWQREFSRFADTLDGAGRGWGGSGEREGPTRHPRAAGGTGAFGQLPAQGPTSEATDERDKGESDSVGASRREVAGVPTAPRSSLPPWGPGEAVDEVQPPSVTVENGGSEAGRPCDSRTRPAAIEGPLEPTPSRERNFPLLSSP